MKLTSQSFRDGGAIPGRCAFAVADPKTHVRLADNLNPGLSWSGAPAGSRSFVLLCIDGDAPTRPDDVNREGRSVPASLPRADFVHWVLVDVPAAVQQLEEGACSRGVVPRGKQELKGPAGSRQGLNDYTGWFKGDKDMEGTYRGYDGPCPPWNDERPHRYRFEVHALDLDRCPVSGDFTAADVKRAIQGHVLASAALTGVYALNPSVQFP
ncbi:MAG TPA: YbhB/YbcL family Raf kinase inhibitor-like protein [Candidatus Binatia bacterium]|nr:YbhB/YbcL family Raf kinase inhibitor-like protein [Candidatus Binatia bacterium]